ncbi:MAG: hypothetical protein GY781_04165 [Gammaproteobacteria bacterium]|nr:hypothetical protein [Gammaproteobacteria bacterium]
MENFSMGAGIASLAFWGFIAIVVIGGIWNDIRKKAEQQKTIRSIVESGQHLDEKVIESILSTGKSDPIETGNDLKLASIIVFFVSIGLAIFGLVMGIVHSKIILPLLGVACLVFCVALGLRFAAIFMLNQK